MTRIAFGAAVGGIGRLHFNGCLRESDPIFFPPNLPVAPDSIGKRAACFCARRHGSARLNWDDARSAARTSADGHR